jgi:hypothetical protein
MQQLTIARTGNSTYKKLAVQWLNAHLCFASSALLTDSFVLVARNHYMPYDDNPQSDRQN